MNLSKTTTVLSLLIMMWSASNAQILTMPLDSNTNDISGYNNHGLIQGVLTHADDRFGNPYSSYHFPGTATDYIYIPTNVFSFDFNIQQSDSVSVSLWAQPEHNGRQQYIFAKRDLNWQPIHASDWDIEMGLQQAIISTSFGANYQADYNDYYSVNPVNWYHLVLTYANGLSQLYVNDTLRYTNSLSMIDSVASTILIGKDYQGEIDDINVYHRFLTAAEVDQLFLFGSLNNSVGSVPAKVRAIVYPNPASDNVKIELGIVDEYQLRLYDMNGRLIFAKHVWGDEYNLNLENFDFGIYTLQLISEKENKTLKLIKASYDKR